MKLKKQTIIMILLILSFANCFSQINKTIESSKTKKYFDTLLEIKKQTDNFELDTILGYIKVGYLFNNDKKNAIVISFDSVSTFTVYELNNNNWIELFNQSNVGFSRVFEIKAYVDDFNFDGIKDIGIKNEISNGTTIMTFRLWLSKPNNTFIYIPEFEEIGNPKIVSERKIIQGFTACCAFSNISLTDYEWNNFKLQKTHSIELESNYNFKNQQATETFYKLNTEKKIQLSKKEIKTIIDDFDNNWILK